MKEFISPQKLQRGVFLATLLIIGILLQRLPVSQIIGTTANFSLFQCYAPLIPSFAQTGPGLLLILAIQTISGTLFHAKAFFLPMAAASLAFSKHGKNMWFVPIIATLCFIAHPVGREAWAYCLLWTIPIICHFWRDRLLFAKSLESTFIGHAVGSVLWLYLFEIPAQQWILLIPIVLLERTVFAVGMTATYYTINAFSSLLGRRKTIA